MKKKELKSFSRISGRASNKAAELIEKGRVLRKVQMSKVFILNTNNFNSVKTGKEQRTDSVSRSEQFNAGIKGKGMGTSLTPDKLPKIHLSKLNGFQEKFEQRLEEIKRDEKGNLIGVCIDLLEMVIKEDFIFCSFLQKIKERLLKIQENQGNFGSLNGLNGKNCGYQAQITHFMVSERQESHKDKIELNAQTPPSYLPPLNSLVMNFDALKEHHFLIQAQESFRNFQALNKDQKKEDDELKTLERFESNADTQSNKDLQTRLTLQQQTIQIQSLKGEISKLREKELKYQKLLTALKNRGYPVDEVYEFDVHKQIHPDNSHLKPIKLEGLCISSDDSSEDN
jgi:hypothetical protein